MAKPVTPTTTYRFDAPTLGLIDQLTGNLSLSKTDVIRSSVAMLRDLLVVASADANAMLEVIRGRHPDAENLTLDVGIGRDGNPEPTVLIDGEEHADVGARAAVIDRKAFVFLTIPDGSASIAVGVGDEAMLIRPQFAVSDPVPWPSENYRIVIPLKVPAAIRTSAPAKLEA